MNDSINNQTNNIDNVSIDADDTASDTTNTLIVADNHDYWITTLCVESFTTVYMTMYHQCKTIYDIKSKNGYLILKQIDDMLLYDGPGSIGSKAGMRQCMLNIIYY